MKEIDAKQMIKMFKNAEKLVRQKKDLIDSFNVFPVPDGDTGTNLSLTLSAFVKPFEKQKEYSLEEVAKIGTEAILMGARGNSGVIISQFICGFLSKFEKNEFLDIKKFLECYENGINEAYLSLSDPKEGTILTVMKEPFEFIKNKNFSNFEILLRELVKKSSETLQRTPDLLKKLKDAGVVDSGGAGFLFFLEGMYNSITPKQNWIISESTDFIVSKIVKNLSNETEVYGIYNISDLIKLNIKVIVSTYRSFFKSILNSARKIFKSKNFSINAFKRFFKTAFHKERDKKLDIENKEIKNLVKSWNEEPDKKSCVNISLKNSVLTKQELINELKKVGNSIVIAGSEKEYKIHFHTDFAEKAIFNLKKLGEVDSFEIDNLIEQHSKFVLKEQKKDQIETAVIAISNLVELQALYKKIDGVFVIDGGESLNPSVGEIKEKIDEVNAKNIIILPNNKNVILTAEKAKKMSTKRVEVVKNINQAEGLALLLNFNKDNYIEQNINQIIERQKVIRSFEVSIAIKDSNLYGKNILKGDYLVIDEKIRKNGKDFCALILNYIKSFKGIELISIYYALSMSTNVLEIKKRLEQNDLIAVELFALQNKENLCYFVVE